MSGAPSEPEKYSIDEMMDRLKGTPSEGPENGELVTRADGTQAIRVRKRKRRSSQPHKEQVQNNRRARIVQVSAALVLFFITAIVIGAAIIYANSSPFREGLVQKIAKSSGAEIDLQQFRMNPKTANAGHLSMKWPEGNVLKSLSLHAIDAEIFPSSFFGKSMNGEEISIGSGLLALQIPDPSQPIRKSSSFEGGLPVNFNRYRTRVLDVALGDPSAPLISLRKSEGSFTSRNQNGLPQLGLYKGDLTIDGWPKLRLDRALFEFRGEETDISSFRMLQEKDERGSFELSGTISPYKPQQLASLAVSLESFQISGITGPAMGRLVSGRIDSQPTAKSNYLSFRPAANSAPKLDIAFRVAPTSKIEFLGFPFLFALSQTIDDTWFEHPVFDSDATGILHREAGVISLRDINFESKGRLALRGEISISANQTLSGSLEVGVAEAMIAASKAPRLRAMFGPPSEGFQWITLKIGGPAAAPTDNFKELFSAASPAAPGSSSPPESSGSTFEELTRPR